MKAGVQCEWPTRRLRFLVRRSLTNDQCQTLAQASQVSFLPMEAISEQGELDLSSIRDSDQVSTGYTLFFEGDVVVAKITPCFENGKGALIKGLTNGVGFGTTELHVLSPGPELDARFLYYVTSSHSFRKLGEAGMTGAAGQKRVPEDFVRDYQIACPPVETQRAIADYLDRETGRLDALVAAKERLLGLLAEKRRALITRAVTRGLNPDVPLRDSGLPWLGQIPKHWETVPLRYLISFVSGATPDKEKVEYWNGDIPWVSPKDMKRDIISDSEDHVTEEALQASTLRLLPAGTVLVVVRGMILAHSFPTALTSSRVTINQDMKGLCCRERMEPSFLRDFLKGIAPVLVSLMEQSAHGTRKLETEVLGNLGICVPSLSEQRAIVTHIERETGKLDALRSATERTIALLKERRAALIAAAVTGQLDSADSGELM